MWPLRSDEISYTRPPLTEADKLRLRELYETTRVKRALANRAFEHYEEARMRHLYALDAAAAADGLMEREAMRLGVGLHQIVDLLDIQGTA